MFFCEKCRVKNEWPESTLKSYGRCEECGEEAGCHDVPTNHLPERAKPAKQRKKKEKPEPKFMLVTHAGETDILLCDTQEELYESYAQNAGSGVACEAYEVKAIELELFARRKPDKTPKRERVGDNDEK